MIVNPRVIKLARSKLESKVEKEIKAEKKKQNVRRRRAAKQNGDVENEVLALLLIINHGIYYVDTLIYLLLIQFTVHNRNKILCRYSDIEHHKQLRTTLILNNFICNGI